MAFYRCGTLRYKAIVRITANPNTTVTLTRGNATFSGTTNSLGQLDLIVTKTGTFTITSDASGDVTQGSTASITLSWANRDCTVTYVKVSPMSAVTVTGWATGTACIYWTRGSNSDGVVVKRGSTTLHTGVGNTLALTSSQNVTGITNSGLTVGTSYTFTVQPYCNINGQRFYGTAVSKTYTAQSFVNSWTISSTQSWTVPVGVRSITIFCAGGGGSSGLNGDWTYASRATGGGGGGYVNTQTVSVTPGQVLTCTIGNGGPAPTGTLANGNSGGTTSVKNGNTTLCSAAGGKGGLRMIQDERGVSQTPDGGNGGSGGGAGSYSRSGTKEVCNGGTNGGNGKTSQWYYIPAAGKGGTGDGKDTHAFGISTETLYCGGGGGGSYGSGGQGGAGGGANSPGSASPNTGGGAGGAAQSSKVAHSGGSGIIRMKCA